MTIINGKSKSIADLAVFFLQRVHFTRAVLKLLMSNVLLMSTQVHTEMQAAGYSPRHPQIWMGWRVVTKGVAWSPSSL